MKNKPNFIVIHTDQHRFDCIGISAKRKGIYTPYIDSIASQGANFTSCYTTCPLCIPQRLSLLTGLTPDHHGLFSNMGIPYIPLAHSLPEEMKKGGYQTALIGRTMHTYPVTHSYGFEYYLPGDPSSERKDTTDAFFSYLRDNSEKDTGGYYGSGPHNNSRAAAPYHLPDHLHQTKWATNRAIDFLANRDLARPFLLFVGFYAPHSPHNPPAEYFNRYYHRDDLDEPSISTYDVPPVSNGNVMSRYINLKDEELRATRAGYYGNIAFIDTQVGRILEQAMRIPDTYVIFTSDHGELLGDHYLCQKNRPYQGAVHIPFMIMGPGIRDCQTITAPIGWHDIMPTLLDLAKLPIPENLDGKSIVPLLKADENTNITWRRYIHGECTHELMFSPKTRPVSQKINLVYEEGSHFLTDGTMKYIWYDTSGTEQLFCLTTDYQEQHDLSCDPSWKKELLYWRNLLIHELQNRPEGFSNGTNLISGQHPVRANNYMMKLAQQREQEGFSLAFSRKEIPERTFNYEKTT